MNDQARKLYDLLGRLGARPGTIECHDDENFISSGTWEPVDEANALSILRDAARRVCDEHGLIFENDGGSAVYEVRSKYCGLKEYVVSLSDDSDYESALIAGLEWIEENRNG